MDGTGEFSTRVVGALEMETRLSELLDRVEEGEEFIITRHGEWVARVVPIRKVTSDENRRETIRKMRELAARNHLGGLKVRDLINEGRR